MTLVSFDQYISGPLFAFGHWMPSMLAVFLASYLIWVFAGLMLILLWRKRMAAHGLLVLLSGGVVAYAINTVIHLLLYRPRPFISFGIEPLITTAHLAGSFPSDHAAVAVALAAGYVFLDKKNAWLFIVLACIASFGRVFAGVHFVGDIAAGAGIGILAANAARHFFRRRVTS